MKIHEITLSPTSSADPTAVVVPNDGAVLSIVIIYPLLFLFTLFVYFILRSNLPNYFVLRLHSLNKKFVLHKNSILHKTYYEEIHDEDSSIQNKEGGILEPLLKFRKRARKSKVEKQAFFPLDPQKLDVFFKPDVTESDPEYNSFQMNEGIDMFDNKEFAKYQASNIFSRLWILIKNGFGNLFSVAAASDVELMNIMNLDQLLFLRTIRLIIQLLVGYTIPSLIFLFPLYAFQEQDPVCDAYCSNYLVNTTMHHENAYTSKCICNAIDKASLAMLKCSTQSTDESNSFHIQVNCLPLWGPVFSMYWCTILTIWLIRREYKKIIFFRNNKYWLQMKPPELYTILLDEIPVNVNLGSQQEIFNHFNRLFPDKVVSVEIASTTGKSSRIFEKLKLVGVKREAVYSRLQQKMFKSKTSKKIPILKEELATLNKEFIRFKLKYQKSLELIESGATSDSIKSVFVTFNSAVASTIAEQTLVHEQKDMIIERAAEPSNTQFDILGFSESNLTFRKYISKLIFFLIIIFWGTLTTFVTGLTNADNLRNELERMSDVLPHAGPIIQKFLLDYGKQIDMVAPLTLIVLLSVVNPFLRQLSMFHIRHSESEIDEINTFYYFVFMVIQLFLFYGIAGTIFRLLQEIIDNPRMLLFTLAQTIPKNAAFYISFIATKLFTMLSMELLRASSFAMGSFRYLWFGKDATVYDFEKEKMGLYNIRFPAHCYLSSTRAELLLIYFIATTYITIQPLIAPVALVFFGLAYLIYGNNFMNIYVQRYDAGAQGWLTVFWCLTSGILTSQVTLIAVLLFKEGLEQVFALWMLFFFTLGSFHVLNSRYNKLLKSVPLNIAQSIDQDTENLQDGQIGKQKPKLTQAKSGVYHYERLTTQPYYFKYSALLNKRSDTKKSKKKVYVYDYRSPVLNEPDILEINCD